MNPVSCRPLPLNVQPCPFFSASILVHKPSCLGDCFSPGTSTSISNLDCLPWTQQWCSQICCSSFWIFSLACAPSDKHHARNLEVTLLFLCLSFHGCRWLSCTFALCPLPSSVISTTCPGAWVQLLLLLAVLPQKLLTRLLSLPPHCSSVQSPDSSSGSPDDFLPHVFSLAFLYLHVNLWFPLQGVQVHTFLSSETFPFSSWRTLTLEPLAVSCNLPLPTPQICVPFDPVSLILVTCKNHSPIKSE
jgi:hypothetical protein